MDIDIHYIIDNFIEWFVLEESKEQSNFELKDAKKRHLFTHKLNHDWKKVLDLRFVHSLDPKIYTVASIKKEMRTEGRNLCYVISGDPAIDNKIMETDFVIDKIFGKSTGTLLINLQVDKLFFETDEDPNHPTLYLGKKADLK